MLQIRSPFDDPADLEAIHHWQIEIQNQQIRRTFGHRLERRVAAPDDLSFGVGVAFEGVLDEAGEVPLVLHDQNAMFCHRPGFTLCVHSPCVWDPALAGLVRLKADPTFHL